MAKKEVPDEDGAAWRRLTSRRDGPRNGDEALTTLADIGAVRRLLDQWELRAVRDARRGNKSWAEIATYLGVTRQSAWERWRDLDSEPESAPAGSGGHTESSGAAMESAEINEWERDLLSAGARRRRANVKVPSVVGLDWAAALHALTDKGLVATHAEPDVPLPDPAESGWFVTDQSPESGARVSGGAAVRVWLRRNDGGAGVREPREPLPPLRSIPEVPEPTGRAAS